LSKPQTSMYSIFLSSLWKKEEKNKI
jgi:hypothetical protein